MDIALSGIDHQDSLLDSAALSTDEHDQSESYSAAQVLEKLEVAWMNEKMSPDLLEHHMEFVDVMLEQLKELEVMIGEATSKTDIRVAAHLMEMDRIKYIISDYLRCRLRKIEEFAQLIASDPIEQTKLTDPELNFVTGYWSSIKAHLNESAGKNMPENVRKINMDKIIVKPEYYKYVFMKANKPVTGLSISEPGGIEEEVIDLDTNDQQLVPFKSVQTLLNSGAIHLI